MSHRARIRIVAPEDHKPDGTVARVTAEADLAPGHPYTYSTIGLSVYVDWRPDHESHDCCKLDCRENGVCPGCGL